VLVVQLLLLALLQQLLLLRRLSCGARRVFA